MVLLAALAIVALGQRLLECAAEPVVSGRSAAFDGWGPATYAAALERLDRDVARERARVAASPGEWLPLEALAIALHARGQLTGSHDDLAAALAVVDQARALAPDGSGPVLARAIVSLTMHRNAAATAEIERMSAFAVPPDVVEQAEVNAIRGDVALYAGRYGEALRYYQTADQIARSPGTLMRLSDWHRHRGEFDRARALLEEGLVKRADITPWMRASYLLQIGAIDLQTGRWGDARNRFEQADTAFPGWWLVKAHLGQMAAAEGDYAAAEQLYREAQQGAERPSVMDALAALYRAMGRTEEAAALSARSGVIWADRVATHPEAYADHAFEAALGAGDTARAWHLAAFNYRSRPYGDGRIGLARAAEARGRLNSARAILNELERTGWRSTEQYRVLHRVCERTGDRVCAARARRKALTISPRAFDPGADLLAFGNH